MKNKISILILLTAILIPQVASAAWWNPFSWNIFHRNNIENQIQSNSSENQTQSGVVQMTREEYKTRFGVEPDVFKESDMTLPVTAALRECASLDCDVIRYYPSASVIHVINQDKSNKWYKIKTTDTHGNIAEGWMSKSVFVKTENSSAAEKTPAAYKVQQPVTSSADSRSVQDWIKLLDFRIQDDQKFITYSEGQINKANTYKDKYLSKITQTDESSGALYLATSLKFTLNLQRIVDAVKARVAEFQKARTEMLTTNVVDKSVWNQSKILEMEQFSTNLTNTYMVTTEEYIKTTEEILQFLKLVYPQGSQQPVSVSAQRDPYVQEQLDYFKKLNEMKATLEAEYKAAGGYWTASQLESNAIQKLKEMGIKSPTSPYGGYINPTGGYTSVMCHSLGSGYDCYGSDGTRIQSTSIPGSGSVQIKSW